MGTLLVNAQGAVVWFRGAKSGACRPREMQIRSPSLGGLPSHRLAVTACTRG